MKFTKIVGFGDSWMYGDELIDSALQQDHPDAHACWTQNIPYRESNCFLGLLGQHYQVPVENFGVPGGSLQSMIWTFLWWLQHEPLPADCLVICGLTDANRFSLYNDSFKGHDSHQEWNKFVHVTWVYGGSTVYSREFENLVKQYVSLCNCPDLDVYNYLQAALLLDGISLRQKINLMQFHAAPPPTSLSIDTLIWPHCDLITFFRDHPGNQNRELICDGGHPNESGHKIISNMLIKEIDRVILSE